MHKESLVQLLQEDSIELELLQGDEAWKMFLNDETFAKLNTYERQKLYETATSKARREHQDVEIFEEIKSEAV